MRSTTLTLAIFALAFSGCDEEPDPEGPATTSTTSGTTSTTSDETTAGDTSTGGDTTTTTGDDTTATGEGDTTTTGEMLGCPYEDPGWKHYGVGVKIPHWELVTHDGEVWNACDYYGSPLVIDTSAEWCGPCQALSAFMAGNDAAASGIFNDEGFVQDYVVPFRDMVNAGCITWVTVLTQNEQGLPPSDSDAASWDASYHNPNIPVVADPTGDFEYWLHINAYPTTFLVNNNFNYLTNDLVLGMMLVVDNLECDIDGDGVPD